VPAVDGRAGLAGLLCAVLLQAALPGLLLRAGLARSNFRGQTVPLAYGLLAVLSGLVMLGAASMAGASGTAPVAAALTAYGALGLLDDALGHTGPKGLRGHLRALVLERRVTTGLVKLAGGLVAGQVIGHAAIHQPWPMGAVDGLILALGANAVNLLDLRPGRACAVWLALFGMLYVTRVIGGTAQLGAAWLAGPAAVMAIRDSRGQAMMGDTGSNSLGAMLAVLWLAGAPSAGARMAALLCLLAFHVAAERWSLSAAIERHPLLRRIDALTGVR
jgi:UDP-GlcNAc:undecaprenyl-phosphate GlcNAc-1-phosphate transferase